MSDLTFKTTQKGYILVTFADAVKLAYINSFNFTGRATRAEYWWFTLFQVLVGFVLGFIGGLIPVLAILSGLFTLVSLPASLAVLFRRLRDAGGWIWLPVAGIVVAIVAFALAMNGSSNGAMLLVFVYGGIAIATFVYTVLPSKPVPAHDAMVEMPA